jgi:hypothetical protein
VDHAAAGFGIDHADMRQGRIRGKGAGDGLWVRGFGDAHRQRDRHPARLTREADHAVGVGPGCRDQDAPAGRQEAAQRRLGDEMAAALQWQAGVLVRRATGEVQDTGAQAGEEVSEIVVPRGDVAGQRLADLGAGGDGAGD